MNEVVFQEKKTKANFSTKTRRTRLEKIAVMEMAMLVRRRKFGADQLALGWLVDTILARSHKDGPVMQYRIKAWRTAMLLGLCEAFDNHIAMKI